MSKFFFSTFLIFSRNLNLSGGVGGGTNPLVNDEQTSVKIFTDTEMSVSDHRFKIHRQSFVWSETLIYDTK